MVFWLRECWELIGAWMVIKGLCWLGGWVVLVYFTISPTGPTGNTAVRPVWRLRRVWLPLKGDSHVAPDGRSSEWQPFYMSICLFVSLFSCLSWAQSRLVFPGRSRRVSIDLYKKRKKPESSSIDKIQLSSRPTRRDLPLEAICLGFFAIKGRYRIICRVYAMCLLFV